MNNEIQSTNDNEILKIYESFNTKKSPGIDGIISEIIVNCLKKIPYLFTNLLNSILRIRYFPDQWKIAIVCMTPKVNLNSNTTTKSFRLISFLKISSKGLEKLINSRLNYYLHMNNKISNYQFGFTKQKSTLQASERVIESMKKNYLFFYPSTLPEHSITLLGI